MDKMDGRCLCEHINAFVCYFSFSLFGRELQSYGFELFKSFGMDFTDSDGLNEESMKVFFHICFDLVCLKT